MVSVCLVGSGLSIAVSAYGGRCPVSHRAELREIMTKSDQEPQHLFLRGLWQATVARHRYSNPGHKSS
jgi:hypothetical protein